jgi:hypothetical protein
MALNKDNIGFWRAMNFQINLEASFPENIIRFIDKLENSSYLITIQSFNMGQEEQDIAGSLFLKVFVK